MTHQFFIQVNFCFKFLGAFKTFVLFLYVPFECNLIIWHRTLGIYFMQFHCCVTMLHTNKNKNYFNDCKLWRSVLYSFFLSVIIFYNNYKSLHHQIFCKTLPVVYAWPSYLYTEARAGKLYKSIKKHFSFEISPFQDWLSTFREDVKNVPIKFQIYKQQTKNNIWT